MVAAGAKPQGSWPCRRLGPGAWPPVERQAWVGVCSQEGPQCCSSTRWRPPPQLALTCARILRAGPSFSPMVVRRCSSVSRGRVSPSIPCSLKIWCGTGSLSAPECGNCPPCRVPQPSQGCVGGSGSPERADPRGALAAACRERVQVREKPVGRVPVLKAEHCGWGWGACTGVCVSPPNTL